MEHLVSRHVTVATGEGRQKICYRESSRNKSQKRFSWWSDVVNETKTHTERERVSKSVSTPTPLIWVMMTRWGRGTSVEAEWESWVREMCCGVLNVGGSEVGGSFMEPQDHSASERWEKWEIFVHYFTTFFKGDYFSAQMGGTQKDLFSQMSLYF